MPMICLADLQMFTEEEFAAAADEWGCNCGPSALACALGITLDEAHAAIPGFDERGYTSPTMMKAALEARRASWKAVDGWPTQGLVRVQWNGPWTQTGANPRWAYNFTHWIASFRDIEGNAYVFDCNGGMRTRASWVDEIAPILAMSVSRSDGTWSYTHFWQIIDHTGVIP